MCFAVVFNNSCPFGGAHSFWQGDGIMILQPNITAEKWNYLHFSRSEFACKTNGECRMSPTFMNRMVTLRKAFKKPIIITSGYRSPAHNLEVADTGTTGPHVFGRAADVLVSGTNAYEMIKLATNMGFTGIGVKQTSTGRFLHLDDLMPVDGFPTRPWVWSY